jgi:hypothetical protein
LKITQLNEAHRVSSIAWDKFYRNIKIELAKHPNERIAVTHMLKMSKEEFDRLMETSPVIPDKIIGEFKVSFSKSEEYSIISKPEICDVLISTEKFRNPWYTDENQAKKLVEIAQKSTTAEIKKKALEQHNILAVKTFYKTFFDLNNREPMEQEVINNLSDTIDIDIIKRVMMDITNKDAAPKVLRPLSGGWSFFRRLRILCSGALIEDIDYYNHVHEMFCDLQARHVQENINVENFGISYDSIYGKDLIKTPTAITGGTITASYFRELLELLPMILELFHFLYCLGS